MNLGQLEHLLALAETGSFSKAAARAHVTQPALSRSIRSLEEELEGKLVDRIGRSNELTPLGDAVVQRARQVLAGVIDLKQTAQQVKAGTMGTLRIGLGSGPAHVLSPGLLRYGAEHYPYVKIAIRRGPVGEQLRALRLRELDVLVIDERAVSPEPGVMIERLPDMAVGIFFRPGHPLARRGRVEFADLLRYPIASTAISPEVARQLVESFGPAARPESLVTLQSDEIAPLVEIACQSDAIFVGLRAAAGRALAEERLVERTLKASVSSVARFSIVTLEGREPSPLLPVVRLLAATHLQD